jgi:hypothetical protein
LGTAPSTPKPSKQDRKSAHAPTESEIVLLERARAALQGEPDVALALATRHAADFPSGTMMGNGS